ncbi:hypothetical protein LOK49_LG05G00290 [Camellia lanceoleosa]|uniref:Uncharacterized protein n=1 Tax=Camellia lanceoleosa TaxID=1840588 RepID=A0ACC0HM37_9ERIC|nr:hypothetical protein LOK49_LG05G00290 [Camellia lanceoleosa]
MPNIHQLKKESFWAFSLGSKSSNWSALMVKMLGLRRSATLPASRRHRIFFLSLLRTIRCLSPSPSTLPLATSPPLPPFAETPSRSLPLPLHPIPKIQQSLDPDFLKTSLFCWVHRLIRLAEKAERTDSPSTTDSQVQNWELEEMDEKVISLEEHLKTRSHDKNVPFI